MSQETDAKKASVAALAAGPTMDEDLSDETALLAEKGWQAEIGDEAVERPQGVE